MKLFRFFNKESVEKARKYLKKDRRMNEPEYLEANGYGEILNDKLEGWTKLSK